MSTVHTRQIVSVADPSDPRPWFTFTVDPSTLAVTITESNGIDVYASRNGIPAVAAQKRDAARRRHVLALDESTVDLAEELHVLAQTLEGDIEFVPASKQRPVYYAHLGFYDPVADEWTVLDFVDGG